MADFLIYVDMLCAEFQRVIDRTEQKILNNLNKARNNKANQQMIKSIAGAS